MSAIAAKAAIATASRRAAPRMAAVSVRDFGMVARDGNPEPIPPGHTLESVQPPACLAAPSPREPDPDAYVRNPVTSAHAVDTLVNPPRLSARDSAALGPSGAVVHGRYGELGHDVARGVPLEYLALLRPAAEGAAAVRLTMQKAQEAGIASGTLLVYGATQPAGMSAVQLASSSGQAVVAVVDGQHSGNDAMVDVIKGMTAEPGTAVAESYATIKANFRDLVQKTSEGDDPSSWNTYDSEAFLSDFKENLFDYIKAYPDTLPAAVSSSHLEFVGKDKDRDTFRANMDAYLSQYPGGAPPIDPAMFDAYFDSKQYAAWKAKFGAQTTAVVTGDDHGDFEPASIVRDMINSPDTVEERLVKQEAVTDAGDFVPYEFSVLGQKFGSGVETKKGGPVVGAVIVVNEDLRIAAEAVEKAKGLRAKAEALQFLTDGQRSAFAAASSVAKIAKDAGASVSVIGSLPGFESVDPTDDDVQEALSAMEIDEDGISRLNYFVQVYRASDFPVYADYAIHRATEELAGPRQIVVTK
uniref:Uncharacterized protein n=1 Tax=Ditylum brightwellii TaxID=49249 RepID=A0A7S1YPB3_9STRA|mmetsp:Transcript_11476/g.17104  ORF Transcript_11476/g.17104 Transcript_11476/m.17104 type:complete len:526 (+) Transcript_11476:170-1747(+)